MTYFGKSLANLSAIDICPILLDKKIIETLFTCDNLDLYSLTSVTSLTNSIINQTNNEA